MSKRPYELVYILGSGHCGSTLLNLLLNAHRDILGLSEIESIGCYLDQPDDEDNLLSSSFWQGVRECYNQRSAQPFSELDLLHPRYRVFRKWDRARVRRWARPNALLLDCIADHSNARMLVDASKFWQRLQLLHDSGRFSIKVIHLVRDGRGVIYSYRRKGVTFRDAYRRWLASGFAARRLRRTFPKRHWLRIQYESLATAPARTLDGVCQFLDVTFTRTMLKYRDAPDHGIGGNRMRDLDQDQIRLDEKWKDEMPPVDRARFTLAGAWLNKWHGY